MMDTRSNWRLLIDGPGDADWNMAVDEAMSESCRNELTPPTFRLYSWSRPTVTLGYFQKAGREIDPEACRRRGIAVVRRMTGGRAVLHGNDLTYSIGSARNTAELPDTIHGSFQSISRGFIEGLRRLGIQAESVASPIKKGNRSPLCFSSSSRHEITCNGHKILGSAQRRWKNGLLQQGSLRLAIDPEIFHDLFLTGSGRKPKALEEEAEEETLGLNNLLHPIPDFYTIAGKMAEGLEQALRISLNPSGLTPFEKEHAEYLREKKYSQDSWTLFREL